jgi:hypothetical protein
MPETTEIQQEKSPFSVLTTKLPLWVSLVLLLVVALIFAWKQVALGRMESRFEEEKQQLTQQYETGKSTLMRQAGAALSKNSEAAHRLFGNALAWAIRGELIRNNLDQIDQYFSELVKVERIHLVALASQEGKVLVASDKKLQNAEFGQIFPAELLNETQVSIHPQGEDRLLVLPVMGLNTRLGTAVLRYTPETLSLGNGE